MDEIQVMKTSDFTLASSLLCVGHDIIGIDKTNRKRVVFIFKRTSDLEVHMKDYFERRLRVEPVGFVQTQRELRGRIHTDYDN